VIYMNQPFNVYINGLTGQVSGDRPWSKVKIAIAVTLALIVVIVAVVLFMKFHGHGGTSVHHSYRPKTRRR
jgi:hypothetical protein